MSLGTKRKDPDAIIDFGVDWSDWLATGETITASWWTVESGLTENSNTFGDTSTTIWVQGGTAGETYTLANKVATSGGRTDERSFEVMVEER